MSNSNIHARLRLNALWPFYVTWGLGSLVAIFVLHHMYHGTNTYQTIVQRVKETNFLFLFAAVASTVYLFRQCVVWSRTPTGVKGFQQQAVPLERAILQWALLSAIGAGCYLASLGLYGHQGTLIKLNQHLASYSDKPGVPLSNETLLFRRYVQVVEGLLSVLILMVMNATVVLAIYVLRCKRPTMTVWLPAFGQLAVVAGGAIAFTGGGMLVLDRLSLYEDKFGWLLLLAAIVVCLPFGWLALELKRTVKMRASSAAPRSKLASPADRRSDTPLAWETQN